MIALLSGNACSEISEKGALNFRKECTIQTEYAAKEAVSVEMPGDGEAPGDSAVAQLESEMEGLDAGKFFYEEETSSTEEGSSETSYGKSSLNSLKNTENFTDSAIEHIFEGQINDRGKAVVTIMKELKGV